MAANSRIEDYFPVTAGASSKRKHDTLDHGQNDNTGSEANSESKLHNYSKVISLGDLTPGPKKVTFDARIVNIYNQVDKYFDESTGMATGRGTKKGKRSKGDNDAGAGEQRAKGYLKLSVKDDLGCILVKLWYADVAYELHLGQLISIWTPHISPNKRAPSSANNTGQASASLVKPTPPPLQLENYPFKLITSIFPERDGGCGIRIRERDDMGIIGVIPLGYSNPFAYDSISDAPKKHELGRPTKVLGYVYGIGPVRETGDFHKPTIDIGITDGTSKASLGLYGEMIRSAMKWIPNSTILLISNASWKPGSRLYIKAISLIEVNPDIVEAKGLRELAAQRAVHVNPPFPTNLFDIDEFESSVQKIKFTLADIDEFAGSTRSEFMGYISLVLLDINLASLYKHKSLFCAECCKVPMFSNCKTARCGQCEEDVELRLNPQIIGSIVDETGMISCFLPMYNNATKSDALLNTAGQMTKTKHMKRKGISPLLWSANAMQELLGCDIADLLEDHGDDSDEKLISLRLLEARLMYSRITILFGWCSTNQKLAICKVIK
ncbi:hypothetical protein FQN49_000317 [Arthroderma sp. PD_2]|nr:hypothetical protein FQN49_000317 [Arthroderma sp. PD_2]